MRTLVFRLETYVFGRNISCWPLWLRGALQAFPEFAGFVRNFCLENSPCFNMLGHGDLVSRLICPVTHKVTLRVPILNLLPEPPRPSKYHCANFPRTPPKRVGSIVVRPRKFSKQKLPGGHAYTRFVEGSSRGHEE